MRKKPYKIHYLCLFFSYSTIAWTAAAAKGVQKDVEYGYKADTTSATVLNFFTGLGGIAFSYAGHNVVLEIQATIPSTPSNPSKGPMWKGVVVAYVVVALCYFPVALVGYGVFGNAVSENILISLKTPVWAIAFANLFVVMHVIGSYQVSPVTTLDRFMELLLINQTGATYRVFHIEPIHLLFDFFLKPLIHERSKFEFSNY